jgi:cephalosporin hydroxylase
MGLWYKFRVATLPWRRKLGLVRQYPLLQSDFTPGEIECLRTNFREVAPTVYVEIGVFWGGSFCKVLQERSALRLNTDCFGIDIWDEIKDADASTHVSGMPNRRKVEQALRKAGCDRFTLLAATAADLNRLVPSGFDLVLHDANHTYQAVRADMAFIHDGMKPGGRLLVHNAGRDAWPDRDYVAADGGPYQAVHDEAATGRWELMEIRERMAVLRKPAG